MLDFRRHHIFFDGSIRLTEEEQRDPAKVVAQFYRVYPLSEIRKDLNALTMAFITGDDEDLPAGEYPFLRANMLAFQEELEKLLEAVYIQSGLQRKTA